MKKIFLVLLALLSMNAFSKEYLFYEGSCYKDKPNERGAEYYEYYVNYSTDLNAIAFYVGNHDIQDVLVLWDEQIQILKASIEKYFEWNKLALEKGVELRKDIPTPEINVVFVRNDGYTTYTSKLKLKCIFFSQDIDDHQIVLISNRAKAFEDESVDCSINDLYFDYDQIKDLYDALSDENIEAKKKECAEQAEIEELFQ